MDKACMLPFISYGEKRERALTPKHRHNYKQDSTDMQSIPSLQSMIASYNLDRFLHSQPGTSRIKLQVSLYDIISYFSFSHTWHFLFKSICFYCSIHFIFIQLTTHPNCSLNMS